MLFDIAVRPKDITEPATEILGEIEEDDRVKDRSKKVWKDRHNPY